MYMMSKKRNKLRWDRHIEKVQTPFCGTHCQRWSAHPRGGTSARGNASSPITWTALRRPRMLLWVGQCSKTTVDQRGEVNFMQNGQLRTSCCSSVIHQFWWQFVVNIAIAGFVNKSSSRAKWRTSTTKVGRIILKNQQQKWKEGWQSRCGRPFARSSWMVGGARREPRDRRSTCTRKHFSRFRSGTSYKSAITEAQFVYSYHNDQNCEDGKRTKMTRAPCRMRTGNSVPRAEKFGNLITADHKVLKEGNESKHNHRHSIVVQNLATQSALGEFDGIFWSQLSFFFSDENLEIHNPVV